MSTIYMLTKGIMMNNILEIKNLNISDINANVLLESININVPTHSICSILGNSGSGKSLLISSIMGLLENDLCLDGEIYFNGKNLLTLSDQEFRKIRGTQIGVLIQNAQGSLNPLVKNKKQLEPFLVKKTTEEMVRLLDMVELKDYHKILNSYPHELSGGMRQRLMLAMSLSKSPKLLILDEPLKGLDIILKNKLIKLLLKIKKEYSLTIMIVTHNFLVANTLSDDVYFMSDGKMVEKGKKEDVLFSPKSDQLKRLLQSEKKLNILFNGESDA